MADADRLKLRPEDRAAPAATEDDVLTVAFPKRARSRFLDISNRLSAHGDALEALFPHVRSEEGKRLLRQAYAANEETLTLVMDSIRAVERG